MSSVLQDLLFRDQSINSSCGGRMECDSLYELGPPPNMILTVPPPPVPPFMKDFVSRLAAEGVDLPGDEPVGDTSDSHSGCTLCEWANGDGVGFIELAQKGPLIDDTWFLVIISSCVGATLVGIILAIAFLKYREGKLKPLSDVALAKKEKALGLERCEAVLYPAPAALPTADARASRALWAGLKPLEGNHYTVNHCQPMNQKPAMLDLVPNHDNNYDYADYSSLAYTTLGANVVGLATHHQPITQCHPAINNRPSQAASFENVGFVPTDDSVEEKKIGPDGCVLSQAAYILGTKSNNYQQKSPSHHYEMVSPRMTPSSRRHKSLERGSRPPPFISAPTSVPAVSVLPPLNSRYSGKYTLTALANGSHTLTPKLDHTKRLQDRRHAHVSLDKSGNTSTSLAPSSPSDHIYASPITSPVI